MKISPIICQNNPINKRIKFNSAKITLLEYKSEFPKISPEFLKAQYPINTHYIYKPVASVKPIDGFVGNYDNLDKFCELYAKKINSQLMIPTEDDIEKLVKRIKKSTGADEKDVRKVMYNLMTFSGYQAFNILNKFVKEKNIKEFGLTYKFKDYDCFDYSSNSAIDYLVKRKGFGKLSEDDNGKTGYILDNISLTQLENYKNSSDEKEREIYNRFLEDLKNDKFIFIIPKCWDIKTKNDGYKNVNMFSGTGYLEDLTVEIIKRIQSGENPDEIYYSDFKERLYNLVDDPETESHINIYTLKSPNVSDNITNKDILRNSPRSASSEYIKAVLKNYIDIKQSQYPKEKVQNALLKYLDEMTFVYSIDSLAAALKKMGKCIETMLKYKGYSKDNTLYLIPQDHKSYSLITLMYSQINGINPKNINSLHNITNDNLNKAKVILDDLSSSGASEAQACYDVRTKYKCANIPLIYAPVVLCAQADNHTQRIDVSCPDEYYFDKHIVDMSEVSSYTNSIKKPILGLNLDEFEEELQKYINKNYKLLNAEDCYILEAFMFKGYHENALSLLFPYMIPDNASDISALILRDLLPIDNISTNKAFKFLESRKFIYQEAYNDAVKIMNRTNKTAPKYNPQSEETYLERDSLNS